MLLFLKNIINYGGILSHGIPNFRLEQDLVKKTIQKILNLGIKVKYNQELGKDFTLETLKKEYDSIFIGIGSNIPMKMNIEGEELEGVFGANKLLEENIHPNYEGKKVAIIGGGNVAMDCARTIKKMGAKEVYVIYRRAEEQMPAEIKEIEEAKEEGIIFLFKNNIVKILPKENTNKVEKIECIKTELVQKEGDLRPSPINVNGTNYKMDINYVIMAVGSAPEKEIINKLPIKTNSKGYIEVEKNYMTSKEGIFAGGDIIEEKATVAWAARSGRNAAEEIDKYLSR